MVKLSTLKGIQRLKELLASPAAAKFSTRRLADVALLPPRVVSAYRKEFAKRTR